MSKPKPNVELAMEQVRSELKGHGEELTDIGSAVTALEFMRLQVRLPGSRDKIVKQAQAGDWIAWRACSEEAAQELRHGRALKGELANFVAQLLDEAATHPKGKKGSELAWRDSLLARAVSAACEDTGLAPTRGDASRDKDGAAECGCSVVARFLHDEYGLTLSEDVIMAAWKNHGPMRD